MRGKEPACHAFKWWWARQCRIVPGRQQAVGQQLSFELWIDCGSRRENQVIGAIRTYF